VGARGGRWSQERRLEFIDFRLLWDGRLNRSDVVEFFGISVPQASLDIARYIELAPHNLSYDKSARVYVATESFRALFLSSAPERFLSELLRRARAESGAQSFLGFAPPVEVLPLPTRAVNMDVLVALQRSIRDGTGLSIRYQSLSRSQPSVRAISPHAFAHNGLRWHVRAYCHACEQFRDFVMARILEVQDVVAGGSPSSEDVAWHTIVKLVLAPHSKLSVGQRRAIEFDYGMTDGEVTLSCRRAFLFYALRHLHLEGSAATPEAQQVVLKNRREVARYLAAEGTAQRD
jgi:hypothetical protein